MKKSCVTSLCSSGSSGGWRSGTPHSSRHKWLPTSRGSSSLGCSSRSKKTRAHTAKRKKRVLDEKGRDVTPHVLYHWAQGEPQATAARSFSVLFAGSQSGSSVSTSSYTVRSSSSFLDGRRLFGLSTKESRTGRAQDSPLPHDQSLPALQVVPKRSDKEKQHVTEEMLDDFREIRLSETDTVSLLDVMSTFISKEAEDAEALSARNVQYAELCGNKVGNDMYVERPAQSLDGVLKNELIQSDSVVEVDQGSTASRWHIYDALHTQDKGAQSDEVEGRQRNTTVQRSRERRGEMSSSYDTSTTGSSVSSLSYNEVSSVDVEQRWKEISELDCFHDSLLVMARHVVANSLPPQLEDSCSSASPGLKNSE